MLLTVYMGDTGSSKGAAIDTQDLLMVRHCGVTMLENFRQQALQVSSEPQLPEPAEQPVSACLKEPQTLLVGRRQILMLACALQSMH